MSHKAIIEATERNQHAGEDIQLGYDMIRRGKHYDAEGTVRAARSLMNTLRSLAEELEEAIEE